jgi:ribonucleoside-diphosphate reductase alpha chain
LAARISISNLQKQTLPSFSDTMKLEYEYINPKTNQKSPLLAQDVYDVIIKNANRLDSAIEYQRDFDFDYFGKFFSFCMKMLSELID